MSLLGDMFGLRLKAEYPVSIDGIGWDELPSPDWTLPPPYWYRVFVLDYKRLDLGSPWGVTDARAMGLKPDTIIAYDHDGPILRARCPRDTASWHTPPVVSCGCGLWFEKWREVRQYPSSQYFKNNPSRVVLSAVEPMKPIIDSALYPERYCLGFRARALLLRDMRFHDSIPEEVAVDVASKYGLRPARWNAASLGY